MADTPKEERRFRWNNSAKQWEFYEETWGGWCVLRQTPSATSPPMTRAEGQAYVDALVPTAVAPPDPARPRSTEGLALVALAKAWLVAMADASKDVWPDRAAFVSKLSWMPHDVLARFLVETEDHVAAVVAGAMALNVEKQLRIDQLEAENQRLRAEFAASQQGGT